MQLIEVFIAPFRTTTVQDILCLAYALSSEGCYALGTPLDATSELKNRDLKNIFSLCDDPKLLDPIFQADKINYEDRTKYRKSFEKYIENMVKNMNRSCYKVFTDELNQIQNNESPTNMVFLDKLMQAKEAMKHHLYRLGYEPNTVKVILKQFQTFIKSRDGELQEIV